ncbi:MAG: HD domain-containing protein [Minisyncoccia bacterium]
MARTNGKVIPDCCRMPNWLEPKLGFLRSKAEDKEQFFARIEEIFPLNDQRYILIDKAYETAKRAFRTKTRDGGERYFEHLRAVALIVLVYMRVRDADIIAAALLHDVVEDIPSWTHKRLTSEFNPHVADVVWWVTKPPLTRGSTKDDVDRKYHRRLRKAPRDAVIVKMADRLHNLMTIWNQDPKRIARKISETRDFILPLAEDHQLLVHEIEDVLRYLEKRDIG